MQYLETPPKMNTLPLTLIYINDLLDKITSTAKLFVDDTALFSVVNDPNICANEVNKDLELISQWEYKWKMSFNPDKNKQAQEVVFSQKQSLPKHPQLIDTSCIFFLSNAPWDYFRGKTKLYKSS